MSNQTLIMVKPDGVRRGLIGEVVGRFENKGFKVAMLKMIQFDEALIQRFYAEHIGKPFFQGLSDFITSGPAIAMVLEGDNVIPVARKLMGATKFTEAEPGTIRGDFAHDFTQNIVHGSDSPESAQREIGIIFG